MLLWDMSWCGGLEEAQRHFWTWWEDAEDRTWWTDVTFEGNSRKDIYIIGVIPPIGIGLEFQQPQQHYLQHSPWRRPLLSSLIQILITFFFLSDRIRECLDNPQWQRSWLQRCRTDVDSDGEHQYFLTPWEPFQYYIRVSGVSGTFGPSALGELQLFRTQKMTDNLQWEHIKTVPNSI